MSSLENIFKDIGNGIKTELINREITLRGSGFKTTLLTIFDLIDTKQDTLIAGTNISIVDNVISSSGGSGGASVSNEKLIL